MYSLIHEIPKEILPYLLIGKKIGATILYMKKISFLVCCFHFIWLLLLSANVLQTVWWQWAKEIQMEFSAELVLGLSVSDAFLVTVFGSSRSNLMLTTISFVFNRSRISASMLTWWWAFFDLRAKMSLTMSVILRLGLDCCSRVRAFSDGNVNFTICFVGLWGCLQWCASALKRIEFLITKHLIGFRII